MDGLGQLSVYVVENNLMYQNPVWTSPGHVENKWIRVQLALNPTKYKVSQSKIARNTKFSFFLTEQFLLRISQDWDQVLTNGCLHRVPDGL